jgi:hypothetical protein
MDVCDFSPHLAQALNWNQLVAEIGQDSETAAFRKMTFQSTLKFHENRYAIILWSREDKVDMIVHQFERNQLSGKEGK